MRRIVFILALTSSLVACAGRPRLEGSKDVVVAQNGLPEPQRADLFSFERPYLIGPFDKLKIDVFGIDALSNKEVQVDAGGRLSFPHEGTMEVAGQTPSQLADMLQKRLRGQ